MAATKERTMPETTAKTNRETWQDWMPNVPPTMGIVDFVRHVNAKLDSGNIAVEDLEAWQDDGVVPYPVEIPGVPMDRYGYPADAWVIIRDLLYEAHTRGIEDLEYLRQVTRGMATVIDNTASHSANNLSWRDFMPADALMPKLLSHDELLAALREQGLDVPSSTLEYYRQQGLLPRPIRRRHGDATRPVYPDWFVPAIAKMRDLQAQGLSLEEIKPRIRQWMLGAAAGSYGTQGAARNVQVAFQHALDEVSKKGASLSGASKLSVSITDAEGDDLYRLDVKIRDS